MIKTEKEYQEAKKRLEQEYNSLGKHKVKMKKTGMSPGQIRMALDPLASFSMQLKEEIEEYEKLKRGKFDRIINLNGIGRTLIALRIYKGMTQKELAQKLSVTEPQVSRDERNEYHGASLEKIQKVLKALDVTIKSEVDVDSRKMI